MIVSDSRREGASESRARQQTGLSLSFFVDLANRGRGGQQRLRGSEERAGERAAFFFQQQAEAESKAAPIDKQAPLRCPISRHGQKGGGEVQVLQKNEGKKKSHRGVVREVFTILSQKRKAKALPFFHFGVSLSPSALFTPCKACPSELGTRSHCSFPFARK